jgi:DNA-binding MarR family transcriptional regulator
MSDTPLYNAKRVTVAIWPTQSVRVSQLARLARDCGCDVMAAGQPADYLLVDRSSETDPSAQDYSEIVDYLLASDADALVWIGMGQLEAAYAALPQGRCHWLIDSDDALALPILAKADRWDKMDQLHDRTRDSDYGALHKISGELADFARTLARIAEQEDTAPAAVSDKPVSFRPAPSSVFAPLSPQEEAAIKPAQIRELIKLRRLRDQHFQADLFADPAWDILLDLLAAKLEGRSVSVSSLCIAAAVPPTTALRWITTMTENGALVRKQDPNDARRVFIELSPDSEARLRAYFADVSGRNGQAI